MEVAIEDKEPDPAPEVSDEDEQLQSKLLSLPGELRNKIYETALIEPYRITITKHLKPPALTSVCRKVRKEAREIWLRQNSFCFDVIDCDGSLLVAFTKLRVRVIEGLEFELYVQTTRQGINWENLKRWCKGVRETEHRAYAYDEDSTDLEMVIYSALKIATETKHRPWEECEILLEALRATAGRVDRRWLN